MVKIVVTNLRCRSGSISCPSPRPSAIRIRMDIASQILWKPRSERSGRYSAAHIICTWLTRLLQQAVGDCLSNAYRKQRILLPEHHQHCQGEFPREYSQRNAQWVIVSFVARFWTAVLNLCRCNWGGGWAHDVPIGVRI